MEDNILSLYTEQQIEDLKKLQQQNEIIREQKEVFFSICNKILDFLYTEEEVDKKRHTPMYSDISIIKDTSANYEMIRKKVHNDAPLSAAEVAMLLNAATYVSTDMARLAKQYQNASQELSQIIENLTFFNK